MVPERDDGGILVDGPLAEVGGVGGPEQEPAFAVSERRLAVAVLCSDLAHDIAPTLAFLRDMMRFGQMSDVDRSIGQDEIARLQSLSATLRRTRRAEHPFVPLKLRALAERAADRARSEVHGNANVGVEIQPGLTITANERALEIALVALLRNALTAAPFGAVTIRSRFVDDNLRIEVEDEGPGLPSAIADEPYLPLALLGPDGRGMGLAMTFRVARDHGWEMSHCRRENRTVFCLEIAGGDPARAR